MQISLINSLLNRGYRGVSSPAASQPYLVGEGFTTATTLLNYGVYWLRPYDLENDFGTEGEAVAGTNNRYVWFYSSDHFSPSQGEEEDGYGVMMGFSSDPAVLPESFQRVVSYQLTTGDVTGDHLQIETPWLVYNPSDADDKPFWLYVHGNTISDGAHGQETILLKSDDLFTWTIVGVTHFTDTNGGHTGYQHVYRNASDDWESWGLAGISVNNSSGRWTSTNGTSFSLQENTASETFQASPDDNSNLVAVNRGGPRVDIDGTTYYAAKVRDNTDGSAVGLQKNFVALVPVASDIGDLDGVNEADLIQITASRVNDFPGTNGYIQSVAGYYEGGVYHSWVVRGYYQDGEAPDKEQIVDYYAYVFDETAAEAAAPVGVRATCSGSTVTVTCNDVLPSSSYKLERSNSSSGPWTEVNASGGTSQTDSGGTSDAINYYRLTKLPSGGTRIVSTYVSSESEVINQHLTRLSNDGGFDLSTVDTTWMQDVLDWLSSEGLTENVIRWVSPAFGLDFSSGSNVTKVGDLYSTLNRFHGGDAQIQSGTTEATHSTSGMDASISSIDNSSAGTYTPGYGRWNHVRQKTAITLAVLVKPGSSNDQDYIQYGNGSRYIRLWRDDSEEQFKFTVDSPVDFTEYDAIVSETTGDTVILGSIDSVGEIVVRANDSIGTIVEDVDAGDLLLTSNLNNTFVWSVCGDLGFNPSSGVYDDWAYTGAGGANCEWAEMVAFDVALSHSQATSLHNLLRGRLSTLTEEAIQADYSATGDGVTNDSTAFSDFQTANDGSTDVVKLTIEPGTYVTSGTAANRFTRGIPHVQVHSTGATFTGNVRGGGVYLPDGSTNYVKLDAVTATDTSVTIKNSDPEGLGRSLADLTNLFEAGQYVYVTSYDLQGFGYPPNPQNCEVRKVSSIDTGTGTVTLTEALSYDHPDDLPEYDPFLGGPATMYALDTDFDQRVLFDGLTWESPAVTYMNARELVYRNCTTSDIGLGNAESVRIEGGTHDKFEMDKLFETCWIEDATIDDLTIQSPAPNALTVKNTMMDTLRGTSRNTTIDGCTINEDFRVGATSYGVSGPVVITDTSIPNATWTQRSYSLSGCDISGSTIAGIKRALGGMTGTPTVGQTLTGGSSGATATITEVNGNNLWLDVSSLSGSYTDGEMASTPSASGTLRGNRFGREWCVEGSLLMLSNSDNMCTGLTVTNYAQNGQTNDITLDASIPTYAGTVTSVIPHPCTDFTASGLSGSDIATVLNNHTDNEEFGTYARFWLDSNGDIVGGGPAYGKLVSLTANVTTAYTGTSSTLLLSLHQFGFTGIRTDDGSTTPKLDIRVDMKETGSRTWSQTGNSGQVGNDTTSEDCAFYLSEGDMLNPNRRFKTSGGGSVDITGEDPSVWPEFVIEVVVDPTWVPAEEGDVLLEGDEQSGTDKVLLEGNEQSGTDILILEGEF